MNKNKNWFTRYGKINLILILITLFAITILLGSSLNKSTKEKLTLIHCANINSDVTRPEGRYCDRVISLNKNKLVFVTESGGIEEYEVIEINTEDKIEYIYNFKEMSNGGS